MIAQIPNIKDPAKTPMSEAKGRPPIVILVSKNTKIAKSIDKTKQVIQIAVFICFFPSFVF